MQCVHSGGNDSNGAIGIRKDHDCCYSAVWDRLSRALSPLISTLYQQRVGRDYVLAFYGTDDPASRGSQAWIRCAGKQIQSGSSVVSIFITLTSGRLSAILLHMMLFQSYATSHDPTRDVGSTES